MYMCMCMYVCTYVSNLHVVPTCSTYMYELGSLLRMLELLYYRESTAYAPASLQHMLLAQN